MALTVEKFIELNRMGSKAFEEVRERVQMKTSEIRSSRLSR